MITRERKKGKVVYNDGDFIQCLMLYEDDDDHRGPFNLFQVSIIDINIGSDDFRRRFPVGALVDVTETVEIKPIYENLNRTVDEIIRGTESSES